VSGGVAQCCFLRDPAGCGAEEHAPADSNWQSELPTVFALGDTWIELVSVADRDMQRLPKMQRLTSGSGRSRSAVERGPAPATLTRWLEVLRTVHRCVPATPQFYAEAARFLVDPIGLDGAFV